MPAAFFGHGTPMNALDDNRYTQAWRAFGASVPTAAGDPRRVRPLVHPRHGADRDAPAAHDPRLLRLPRRAVRRRVPGARRPGAGRGDRRHRAADLGRARRRQLGPRPRHVVGARARLPARRHPGPAAGDQRHQVRSPSTSPSVPSWPPLRDRGVLVVGSGNVVHNLGRIDWAAPESAFDWNRRFDDDVAELLTSAPAELAGVESHADYALAHPTPDHLIPLLYLAGRRRGDGRGRPRPRRRLRDGVAVDGVLHGRRRAAGARRARCRARAAPTSRPDETNL